MTDERSGPVGDREDGDEFDDDELVAWLQSAETPQPVAEVMAERWVEGIVAQSSPMPRRTRVRVVNRMSDRRRRGRSLLVGVGTIAALAALIVAVIGGGSGTGSYRPVDGSGFRLVAYDGCGELLGQMKHQAETKAKALRKQVTSPSGGVVALKGGSEGLGASGSMTDTGAVPSTPLGPPHDTASSPFSSTNLQEPGVDEADQVKAVGDRLFDVRGYVDDAAEGLQLRKPVLRELAVTGTGIKVVSQLELGWGSELLTANGNLWVLGTDGSRARATLIDIAGSEMRVAWEYEVDGEYLSGRVLGGRIQLVVASTLDRGSLDSTSVYDKDRLQRWEDAVEKSGVDAWLPQSTVRSFGSDGGRPETQAGPALRCQQLLRPDSNDVGFDSTLIVSLPPDGAGEVATAGAVGSGEVVYASPTSVYVAGRGESQGGLSSASPIHRFSVEDGRPRFVASGRVEGRVYGPLAMSELDGVLRVASTVTAPMGSLAQAPGVVGDRSVVSDTTDNLVTTLVQNGDRLEQLGRLAGLGKPHESITAARFDGTTAYISTAVAFRDPLYVIDLADPRSPRLLGSLDVPGSPLYLHRVSDTALAAVSSHQLPGTTEFQWRPAVRVAIFDVSDPSAPRQSSAIDVPGSAAPGVDHHQYLYLTDKQVLVMAGLPARAFALDGGVVRERWQIGHDERPFEGGVINAKWSPPVKRVVVRGDRVVTISDAGAMVSDLATGREIGFAPYWP